MLAAYRINGDRQTDGHRPDRCVTFTASDEADVTSHSVHATLRIVTRVLFGWPG